MARTADKQPGRLQEHKKHKEQKGHLLASTAATGSSVTNLNMECMMQPDPGFINIAGDAVGQAI